MQPRRKLPSEVEGLALSIANPADALREIAELSCKRTSSRVVLLVRFHDDELGATVLAHPGLSIASANELCKALEPCRTECHRTAKAFSVPSTADDTALALPEEVRALKVDKLLVVPLYKAGKPLGMLVLGRRGAGFDPAAIHEIERTRTALVLLLEQTTQLDKISVYADFANFDGLTGLHNHRYFQEALAKEIARAQRLGYPVSLVLIDIDHFKTYNDSYGHPHGDLALKEIANVLKRSIRSYDLAARYGGEELVLVLPQVSPHRALPLAERIRAAVAALPFRAASESESVQLTISAGIAGLPANAKSKSELVKRADQALYLAKEEGRNRVAVSLVRSRRSIRFAYCPPAFTSSYYLDVLSGVREVIEQLGGIELIARAADKESNTAGLARICRSLVRAGVDAIALAPQSDAVLPVIRQLNRANLPVFCFNVPSQLEGADVVSYIGYQQKEAGREVARYLIRVLRGRGSVLVLKGHRDDSSVERLAGFREELAAYPNLRIVGTPEAGWERERARRVVQRALKTHALDAIFATNDEMALGAADAVGAARRRGEIFVVGIDGTHAARQAIREGALTATLNTNPAEMGRILMRTVVRGLNKRERVESEIVSPINIIDLENVGHY
jgi:diguanylate cyclase (GGDEF)-like protein